MCSKVIQPSSLVVVFETLLSAAATTVDEEKGNPAWQAQADFYITCILSCLPWGGAELSEVLPFLCLINIFSFRWQLPLQNLFLYYLVWKIVTENTDWALRIYIFHSLLLLLYAFRYICCPIVYIFHSFLVDVMAHQYAASSWGDWKSYSRDRSLFEYQKSRFWKRAVFFWGWWWKWKDK